jgi:diacylglycerol kinase (ATP)
VGSIGPTVIAHSLQRIAIVFNPNAGGLRGGGRARLDAAVECFRRAGREVELMPTTGPNMAGELGRAAIERGFDVVLAAGGDGTINEVLNGIVGSQIVFGALPAGTANVLANEIGLARRPDLAAAQLLDAVPLRIGAGAFDHPGSPRRHFLMMAGAGLDARIVHELDLELKRKIGKLSYWHGGFKQLGRVLPKFRITVDGVERLAGFALMARVRNYGGDFEIAKNVRLTDSDFEIVILEQNRVFDFLRFLFAVIFNRLDRVSGVSILRACRAEISAITDEPVHIQADGEAIGFLPATISLIPDAVTLLVPKRYAEG